LIDEKTVFMDILMANIVLCFGDEMELENVLLGLQKALLKHFKIHKMKFEKHSISLVLKIQLSITKLIIFM